LSLFSVITKCIFIVLTNVPISKSQSVLADAMAHVLTSDDDRGREDTVDRKAAGALRLLQLGNTSDSLQLRFSGVPRQQRVTEDDDVTAMGSIDVTGKLMRRESMDGAGVTADLKFSPNISGGSRKHAMSRYSSTSMSSSFKA